MTVECSLKLKTCDCNKLRPKLILFSLCIRHLGLILCVHRALQDPDCGTLLKMEKNKVILQSMQKVPFHVKFGNMSLGSACPWFLLIALWGIPSHRFSSIDAVASGLPSQPWLQAAKLPDERAAGKQEGLSISCFLKLFIVLYQSFLLQGAQSQEWRAHIQFDHVENVSPSWLERSSPMPWHECSKKS